MAKDSKIRMPSSGAGLTQYYDTKTKLQIKPAHVVLIIILVIVIQIFLYMNGYALLGIENPN